MKAGHRKQWGVKAMLVVVLIGFVLGFTVRGSCKPSVVSPPPQAPSPPPTEQSSPPSPPPLPPSLPPVPIAQEVRQTPPEQATREDRPEGVFIHECPPGQPEVEATVAEGGVFSVDQNLIREVTSCKYGVHPTPLNDCVGLLDAYLHKGGIDLDVHENVLGGNPGPKGQNQLKVKFLCGGVTHHSEALAETETAFVNKVMSGWASEADREGDSNTCSYRGDIALSLPNVCRMYTDGQTTLPTHCFANIYNTIAEYTSRLGPLPFNYHSVIKCMLSRLPGSYAISDLRAFARANHPVFLVRIKDRTVEWDSTGKQQTWKHELTGFSIFQMSLYVIENALRLYPDLTFDPPVYILINALDEPRVGPGAHHMAPSAAAKTALRMAHQAESIPSPKWFEDWTQWPPGKMFAPLANPVPLMSWSTVPGWQRDVISPNRHPGSCHTFFNDPRVGMTSFEEKEDTVLFRAFSTACDPNGKGPRQRLVCYAEKHSGELVVEGKKLALDIGGGRGYGPSGSQKFMAPAKQAKAKYILLLDGVVAAFRSTWLLQSGSVILAAGAWKDVRTQLLKPWVHYIPFSSDLHDFEMALSIVVKNETYAKWVAENAREAGRLLSGHPTDGGLTFDSHYYASLLKQYSSRVTYTDTDEGIPWTSDKQCEDWKTTTGRVKQCLPNSYACGADAGEGKNTRINTNYFGGSG